jgi:hypothetical protein
MAAFEGCVALDLALLFAAGDVKRYVYSELLSPVLDSSK